LGKKKTLCSVIIRKGVPVGTSEKVTIANKKEKHFFSPSMKKKKERPGGGKKGTFASKEIILRMKRKLARSPVAISKTSV